MVGKCIWALLCLGVLLGFARAEKPLQEEEPAAVQLAEGLHALTFEYALGSRLHRAHVTESDALATLSQALRVVAEDSAAPDPTRSHVLGRRLVMILDLGERRRHSFHVAGRNQLHSKDWGRLTLDPAFFKEVEAWISDLEQTQVRLCVENPFPEERLQRLFEFQALDDRPWQEAKIQGPKRRVLVHGSHGLKGLQNGYRGIYVPSDSAAGESWGYSVELSSWAGEPNDFTLVDATHCATRPLHAALLRHKTLGPVWVDDAFRDALLELHTPSFPVPAHTPEGEGVGFAQVRAAAESLVGGSSRFLLYRGVLPGETDQQHVWTIRWGPLRQDLVPHLLPAGVRPQSADVSVLRAGWDQRPIELGSLTWTDGSGTRWTLHQRAQGHAWLPPVAEWEGIQAIWPVLQESVR
ncbi:MAG: hypothetical protein P1V35_01075 [Planctomycetota bacterium]|nr:hypothetical protein [Planctomycetota bacterium]